MRTRIAAPALVGALALAAVATPATAFAATATNAAPVVTSATMTSFSPGLTGVLYPVLRVSAKDASGIKSIKALPVPDADVRYITEQDVALHGPALPVAARTATTMTVSKVFPFNAAAGQDRMPNEAAGHWTIMVLVTAKDGRTTWNPHAGGLTITRADVLSAKAGSASVRKGATVQVKGQLNRADWSKGVWAGNGSQWVQLQFRKAGTTRWVTEGWVKTAANGSVSASARDWASGSWRLSYNGNAVSGAAVSGQSYVGVK